jgi:hypothetical protein
MVGRQQTKLYVLLNLHLILDSRDGWHIYMSLLHQNTRPRPLHDQHLPSSNPNQSNSRPEPPHLRHNLATVISDNYMWTGTVLTFLLFLGHQVAPLERLAELHLDRRRKRVRIRSPFAADSILLPGHWDIRQVDRLDTLHQGVGR